MQHKIVNFIINPQKLFFKAWAKLQTGSFVTRLEYDVLPRPHYAFCVYHGARLAHLLGLERVSVAEFGVAGGAGLIELERMAEAVEKEFPVKIDVYGFDTGEGLPDPVDYRDLPYIWQSGFYKMDQDELRKKLSRAELVLGDVKETVPTFFNRYDAAPLAAAFFDLDFWSSTQNAFDIFDAPPEKMLPRIFCYCDDVLSSEYGGLLNDYVGQLAAIREYNERRESEKLAEIAGFSHLRKIRSAWNDKIFVHHAFNHPMYNTYVHSDQNRQLSI